MGCASIAKSKKIALISFFILFSGGSLMFLFNNHSKSIYKDNKVQIKENIIYKSINNKLIALDKFELKSSTNKKRPVIIYVHGGGWNKGSKKLNKRWDYIFKRLVRKDFVGISIDYRLDITPDYQPNDPIDDVKDAIIWVYEHAVELGIDKDKVGLAGASAGGHLVLMTVLDKKIKQHIDYAVAWYPVTDLLGMTKTNNPMSNQLVEDYLDGSFQEVPASYEKFSPIMYTDEVVSPIFLIHGTGDELVPAKQSESFYNKAKDKVELQYLKNGNHGFTNIGIKKSTKDTLAFILKNGM